MYNWNNWEDNEIVDLLSIPTLIYSWWTLGLHFCELYQLSQW